MASVLTRRAASGWILLLPAALSLSAAVPDPEVFFGFRMGADRKLAAWDRVVDFFTELGRQSDRVRTEVVGRSTEGRPFLVVTIADPKTLRRLDHYREIQARLADPRRTGPVEAEPIFLEGKAVVAITCSIHSTEVASTHTAIEFAHRMATAGDPKTRAILENVIFLMVPSLNPDGIEIVRKWYEETLGTPYEGTTPPELYQKYAGHDNNRDWYIFSQAETRVAIEKLHNAWHPQIVYDVHQQGPWASRMFIPPWMDPVDPNIDSVVVQLGNMIGMGMAADLTTAGKKGVVVNALYDYWTPARHYQAYHGGMRILSESASARLASPIMVTPEQIVESGRGYDPKGRSWNHLDPWLGGEWKPRDIVEYQLIAWESCLYQAALRREDLLRAFYRIGQRAVERAQPYAFVVPGAQDDPGAARTMLETLSFGLVEVERAAAAFQVDGREYAAGAYVIRMQQPYSAWAKTLLERQDYPDLRLYPGGPPKRPYDVTAHTLPLLMGVEVIPAAGRFQAQLERAGEFSFTLKGAAPAEGVLPASNVDSWRTVNRWWREGRRVWRDRGSGDFSLASLSPDCFELRRPRIGLYRSWQPSMDEGWTRWVLEQFGFPYDRLTNPDIEAGRLESRFDVIVFPDQQASALIRGYSDGSMPPPYTGGLNSKALASLKSFASLGGTLVFLNQSSDYAIEHLGVAADNAIKGKRSTEYYSPGSLLFVRLERHALTYGLPDRIAVWSQGSPVFVPGRPRGAAAVARYPASGVLASGWLLGEELLRDQAALLEAPFGRGRVILFGMRPQYRAQSYQAFKIFFNALVER